MRGLLDFLTGPSPAAQALRDKYLFMVGTVLAFLRPFERRLVMTTETVHSVQGLEHLYS